jgi:hypothetical protein
MTTTIHVAKIGNRKFTAAVSYQGSPTGWLVSDPCGQKRTAIKNLLGKLQEKGQAVSEYSTKDLGDLSRRVEIDEEAPTIKRIDPEVSAEVTPPVAPRMDGGYVTPLSDREAWADVYRQARAKFDSVTFEPGETHESRKQKVYEYRRAIGDLMESISFISPWRRTVGGDHWIRFSGELDHTVKAPKAGEGRVRERFHRDLSGIIRDVSKEGEKKVTRAEKRAANKKKYREQRVAEREASGAVYKGDKGARNAAWKYAAGLSKAAKEAGHDTSVQRLWYKFGFVVSLRSQGALPHVKFEEDLKAAGYTEEDLTERVQALAA